LNPIKKVADAKIMLRQLETLFKGAMAVSVKKYEEEKLERLRMLIEMECEKVDEYVPKGLGADEKRIRVRKV